MKNITTIILVLVIPIFYGCPPGNSVPSEAVKYCLDKDGIPEYKSGVDGTRFTCKISTINFEKEKEVENIGEK